MKNLNPLIVIFSLLCFWQSAGASNLGFGATTYSADTLNLGDTLRISTFIKNYSDTAYTSTLSFKLTINGIQNVNQNIFPNPVQGQQLNLAPGDSLQTNMIVVITPAYFVVGPDILVVWPFPTDGSIAHDSLIKQIIVRDYGTGIDEALKGDFIRTWLSNEQFNISTNTEQIELNHVSFYNLVGEQVYSTPIQNKSSIPVGHLPKGIYAAEIVYNGKYRKIVKVSK